MMPCLSWFSSSFSLAQQAVDDSELRSEEETDYFKKWLTEDAVYIIDPKEKEVFEKLITPEEKEQFIEQFWRRRDPDLKTAENEFKEEHYRRIAYSNEKFYSGEPGWMTDRGRIYILHGPPDELESHPNGGAYYRPMHEGGGQTSTFPFEIWWYRQIPGIGSDIELEFVDRNGGNQYRLALDPNYKDALLYIAGAGPTLAEEMGMATKAERPFFSPGNKYYPLMSKRAKDNPFNKYETYAAVQQRAQVKFTDLQEIVKVNLSFDNLAFQVRKDYFSLNEGQALVPVTIEIDNKNLSFAPNGPDRVARLAVYGMVTSIQNRIVAEFEDEVTTRLTDDVFRKGLLGTSVYQKVIVLDKKLRYKLDLVVKDLESENMGARREALVPPSYDSEKLSVSSILLSDFIEEVEDTGKEDQMFVLGDVWIRPNMNNVFHLGKKVGVYLHAYNFALDQSTLVPELEVTYTVVKGQDTVMEVQDAAGRSIHFFSGQRVVLLQDLPVDLLQPGEYRLEVSLRDLLTQSEVRVTDSFTLRSPTG
jgi:GWxTD domain-containing protein